MSYFELHKEIARHYEKENTQKLLTYYRVTTEFAPEEKHAMLQKFPAHIPFATEENWNIVDRQVVNREIEFTLEDGTVVYPHTATEGRDYDTPLPEITPELFSKIYSYIEDKINHAGIKMTPTSSLYGSMTAYNHKTNEIGYDPQHPSREILLVTLFVSYFVFIFLQSRRPAGCRG